MLQLLGEEFWVLLCRDLAELADSRGRTCEALHYWHCIVACVGVALYLVSVLWGGKMGVCFGTCESCWLGQSGPPQILLLLLYTQDNVCLNGFDDKWLVCFCDTVFNLILCWFKLLVTVFIRLLSSPQDDLWRGSRFWRVFGSLFHDNCCSQISQCSSLPLTSHPSACFGYSSIPQQKGPL